MKAIHSRYFKSLAWLVFLVSLWFVLDFALTARRRVSQIAEYQTAFANQSTGSIRQDMVSSTGILSTFLDDYQTTGPVTAMQRLKEQEAWIGVEQVDSQSLQLRAWDEQAAVRARVSSAEQAFNELVESLVTRLWISMLGAMYCAALLTISLRSRLQNRHP